MGGLTVLLLGFAGASVWAAILFARLREAREIVRSMTLDQESLEREVGALRARVQELEFSTEPDEISSDPIWSAWNKGDGE